MSSRPLIESCYMSRGIQTDPVFYLCETYKPDILSETQDVSQALPSGPSLSDTPGQVLSMTDNGSAYTQPYALIPTNQVETLASLGSRCPSACRLPSRRIVSFPVSSPQLAQTLAKQTRVVSMPEITKSRDKLYFHSSPADGSFSTDPSQDIIEEQLRESVCMKSYPSDLPCTPSPPSSPDSLVIVGNAHVCEPHFRDLHSDEDDWTAWASSPPRPIPALHGPLSLPYARCPSGAEGTVIEGQDLSHKIWGLGTDNVQGGSRYKKSTSTTHIEESLSSHSNSHHNSNPERVECTRRHLQTLAPSHNRDAVIDLSQPSTFHPNIQSQPMTLGYGTTNATVSLSFRSNYSGANSDPSQPGDLGLDRVNTENIWLTSGDNYVSVKQNSNMNPKHYSYGTESPWKGLGIPDFMTFRKVQNPEETENRLNKAASAFIPGNSGTSTDNPWQLIQQQELESSSLPSQLDTQTRQKPFSNGLNHTWKGEQNASLLATPSTTSSQWSPVFALTTPDLNAPRIVLTTSMGAYDPSVYSPQEDYQELYPNKLMNMQEQQNFLSIQRSNNFAKPCQQGKHTEPSLRRKPHSAQQTITNDPTKQVLSGKRPNLSQQHPRSIPLARLIQRRLSSVPEELRNGNKSSTILSQSPLPTNACLESRLETSSDYSSTQTIIEPTYTHLQTSPDETDGGVESVMINAIVKLPHSRTDEMVKSQVEGVIPSTGHDFERGKENMTCSNAKPGIREGRNKTHKKTTVAPKTSA